MKKEDVKTGMLVRTSDDGGNILRLVVSGTMISMKNGGIPLDWFDEDFNYRRPDGGNYNIIEIYSEPTEGYNFCADFDFWLKNENFLEHSVLLWTRGIEMTVEEIENKLGIKNLKIIG